MNLFYYVSPRGGILELMLTINGREFWVRVHLSRDTDCDIEFRTIAIAQRRGYSTRELTSSGYKLIGSL